MGYTHSRLVSTGEVTDYPRGRDAFLDDHYYRVVIVRKNMCMLDKICAKQNEIYAIARRRKAEKLWAFGSCAHKNGFLRKQAGWIRTWIEIHCDELSAAWELLRRGINPPEIAPLSR